MGPAVTHRALAVVLPVAVVGGVAVAARFRPPEPGRPRRPATARWRSRTGATRPPVPQSRPPASPVRGAPPRRGRFVAGGRRRPAGDRPEPVPGRDGRRGTRGRPVRGLDDRRLRRPDRRRRRRRPAPGPDRPRLDVSPRRDGGLRADVSPRHVGAHQRRPATAGERHRGDRGRRGRARRSDRHRADRPARPGRDLPRDSAGRGRPVRRGRDRGRPRPRDRRDDDRQRPRHDDPARPRAGGPARPDPTRSDPDRPSLESGDRRAQARRSTTVSPSTTRLRARWSSFQSTSAPSNPSNRP